MSRARGERGAQPGACRSVYEHLVTAALEGRLPSADAFHAAFAPLDDAGAHIALAHHVAREIEREIDELPGKDRAEHARAFACALLDHLATLVDDDTARARD